MRNILVASRRSEPTLQRPQGGSPVRDMISDALFKNRDSKTFANVCLLNVGAECVTLCSQVLDGTESRFMFIIQS